MSAPGVSQPVFRPLEPNDVEAISRVHRNACLIAYRFINWRYPLDVGSESLIEHLISFVKHEQTQCRQI